MLTVAHMSQVSVPVNFCGKTRHRHSRHPSPTMSKTIQQCDANADLTCLRPLKRSPPISNEFGCFRALGDVIEVGGRETSRNAPLQLPLPFPRLCRDVRSFSFPVLPFRSCSPSLVSPHPLLCICRSLPLQEHFSSIMPWPVRVLDGEGVSA